MRKKIAASCFSNSTEFADWTAANCDRCIKAPKTRLDQHDGLEYTTRSRCAMYDEIEVQLMGYGNEPVSPRTLDATRCAVCPNLRTSWPQRKHRGKKDLSLTLNFL